MDKYVIDLDKALDELELNDNDDCSRVGLPPSDSARTNINNNNNGSSRSGGSLSNRVSLSSNSNTTTSNAFTSYFQLHADPSSSILDEQEADFAIHSRPPKILNSLANNNNNNSAVHVPYLPQSSYANKLVTTDQLDSFSSVPKPLAEEEEEKQTLPEPCLAVNNIEQEEGNKAAESTMVIEKENITRHDDEAAMNAVIIPHNDILPSNLTEAFHNDQEFDSAFATESNNLSINTDKETDSTPQSQTEELIEEKAEEAAPEEDNGSTLDCDKHNVFDDSSSSIIHQQDDKMKKIIGEELEKQEDTNVAEVATVEDKQMEPSPSREMAAVEDSTVDILHNDEDSIPTSNIILEEEKAEQATTTKVDEEHLHDGEPQIAAAAVVVAASTSVDGMPQTTTTTTSDDADNVGQDTMATELVDAAQLTDDQINELSEDILDLYLNDLATDDKRPDDCGDEVTEAVPVESSSSTLMLGVGGGNDDSTPATSDTPEQAKPEEDDDDKKIESQKKKTMIEVTEIVDIDTDDDVDADRDCAQRLRPDVVAMASAEQKAWPEGPTTTTTPADTEERQVAENVAAMEKEHEDDQKDEVENARNDGETTITTEDDLMAQMLQCPITTSDADRLQNQQQVTAPPNASVVAAATVANMPPGTSLPSTMITSCPTPAEADYRGGLVQNIAFFERQEMPNGLTEEEQMLGKVKPLWMPDDEAPNCLHCDSKFTMIKRRHHCRSCGKVLCGQCCNFKAKLTYLEGKEARVCQLCYSILMKIEDVERINGRPIDITDGQHSNQQQQPQPSTSTGGGGGMVTFPDPNRPMEYCSTVSPLEQAASLVDLPPPVVMVPVGVLKRPERSNMRRPEGSSDSGAQPVQKQVIFSDGVRPGGDLVEEPSASSSRLPADRPVSRSMLHLKSPPADKANVTMEQTLGKRIKSSRVHVADHKGENLPPIVNYNELKAQDPSLPSKPNYAQLLVLLRNASLPWITFGMTKNLFLITKIVPKPCCKSSQCWSFVTRGLTSVVHDEIMVNFDCATLIGAEEGEGSSTDNIEDKVIPFPRDVFRLITTVYDSASKATVYPELSHIFFPDGLFGNKENSGFIFVRPTLQCFQNLQPPSPPFLVALLIHKWEIPWAKVFPLRLVLRLGFQYGAYPTPVISYPNRKSVYFEIGHTIMNVLADFRNFQYTLSGIEGLAIHLEDRQRATVSIPKIRYEKACKVLSASNEHVLAFGGNFSTKADSHLVCIQNEQDDDVHNQYRTEVAGPPTEAPRHLTGANFIVFSGALKSSTGLKAKMSIVEDGLLVQIPPNTMEELRAAIRDMKDFKVLCCRTNEEASDEWVQITWADEELNVNLGVRSQVDGMNLEGLHSTRIFSTPDFSNDRYLIRWIEIFLLQMNEDSPRSELVNTSQLAGAVADAFCVALVGQLDQLYEAGLTKIGLRISLDSDKVGYETGSNGQALPPQYLFQLDSALIPVIMENVSTANIEDPLVIEMLFCILLK